MPTYKLNWIKKIQVKSSKNTSNKMRQNLSRKTAAAKRIFLPYLNSSEKSEKHHVYRGWKVEATVQITAQSELQIKKMKNQTVHRLRAGRKLSENE